MDGGFKVAEGFILGRWRCCAINDATLLCDLSGKGKGEGAENDSKEKEPNECGVWLA